MPKNPKFFDPALRPDGRLDAPAFHRNHAPIWSVLAPYLADATGHVLEAGSGTGQHVVEFARRSPGLTWWPSDYEPLHLQSIEAWRAYAALPNIQPARFIDLAEPDWGFNADDSNVLTNLTAIFCANVIHIAPWPVAQGLLTHAASRLRQGGKLFLYGPFKREGQHTAPSNEAFDQSLKSRDPAWGVRDIADIEPLAHANGLSLTSIVPMPANNMILIFGRTKSARGRT
jgi:SAM-dependent methyltransferase